MSLHTPNKNMNTRLTYLSEEGGGDDNADSFMVHVSNTKTNQSILLTGDATGVNTRRLLDNQQDVKTIILLASHHGSSSHGSNNLKWIEAVSPQWIFISAGLQHGHPREEIYNNFRKAKSLQTPTQEHEIVTYKTKKIASTLKHFTNRPIFSTLSSGDLVATFNDDENKPLTIETKWDNVEQEFTLNKNNIEEKTKEQKTYFNYKGEIPENEIDELINFTTPKKRKQKGQKEFSQKLNFNEENN